MVPDGETNAVTLTWVSEDVDLRCLVQLHTEGLGWEAISGWLERGVFVFEHRDRELDTTYRYRLRVMDTKGRINRDHNELSV